MVSQDAYDRCGPEDRSDSLSDLSRFKVQFDHVSPKQYGIDLHLLGPLTCRCESLERAARAQRQMSVRDEEEAVRAPKEGEPPSHDGSY